MKIWINGKILNRKDAVVNVLSPTAQYGLNVFESIRFYWNEDDQQLYGFRVDDHLDRLDQSCKIIRIPNIYERDEIRNSIYSTIIENCVMEDINVRVTLYVDGDGEGSWNAEGPTGLFIAPYPRNRSIVPLEEGRNACISSWRRIHDNSMSPRVKAGANYINGRYAALEAQRNGFDLPILLNDHGHVAEGAGACLFMIDNDVFVTPTLASSILRSITRDTIIELVGNTKYRVVERDISRTELYTADEIFLCGSSVEIAPITSIDHYTIGSGQPGPMTQDMLSRYLDTVGAAKPDKHNWLTPVIPR